MNKENTVDDEEIAKFAKLANHWWDKEGDLRTLHDINPARLEFIHKHCSFPNATILDVGCGGGILCESLAMRGASVTGIDAENTAIEAAKAHALKSGLSIHYECTPIEDFNAISFDVITCMEMLEHVSEPEAVLAHCARLLKSGGYLFLSTINRTTTAYLSAVIAAEYVLGLLPKQTHEYKKFIQPAELAFMVRRVGLEVVGLEGIAYNPLNRTASLQDSVSVNYLMSCFKA